MTTRHDEGEGVDVDRQIDDLRHRVTRLEGAFEHVDNILERMDKKLDDLTSIATRITQIEERQLANSSAADRAFTALERAEADRHKMTEELARVDKEATQKIAWIKGVFFACATLLTVIGAMGAAHILSLESRIATTETHLHKPHSIDLDLLKP